MSFWALILAACGGGGGGGGPKANGARIITGWTGPVKGAGVYVDVDNDGRLNKAVDHFVATTNGQGGLATITAGGGS